MNLVDIVSSTIILISLIVGLFQGIFKPIGYIFALLFSLFFSSKYYLDMSIFLKRFLKLEGNFLSIISFVFTFLLIFGVMILIVLILTNILKKTPLIIFDKIAGIFVWGIITLLIIGFIFDLLNGLKFSKELSLLLDKSFIFKLYKTLIHSRYAKID